MAIAFAFACTMPCSPLTLLRLMLTEFLKGTGGIRFYNGVGLSGVSIFVRC